MGQLAMGWHFHLPSIASPIEVHDHVCESLAILLRAHEASGQPVLLSATGMFLELCSKYEPWVISEIVRLSESGIVSMASTYFCDTDPFEISHGQAYELLARDVEVKFNLLGEVPLWFVPANFAWMLGTERHLRRLGVDAAVLDSRHLETLRSQRTWSWSDSADGCIELGLEPQKTRHREYQRLGRAEFSPGGQTLGLGFRDWGLTRQLTFGNENALRAIAHGPELRRILKRVDASAHVSIVVDDGDRVRAQSRKAYELLTETAGSFFDWGAPAWPKRTVIGGIPAFIPAGMADVLHGTDDAKAYWRLLREAESMRAGFAASDDVLALYDVFYAYWPDPARRVLFAEAVLNLLEGVQSNDFWDIGDAIDGHHPWRDE